MAHNVVFKHPLGTLQEEEMTQDFGQASNSGLNVQELQARGVNPTWIGKLNEIHGAGILGFKYGIVKTERPLQFLTKFSVLAFFFTWIYYLIKGMWKKALVIIAAGFAVGIVSAILFMIFFPLGCLVYIAGILGLLVYVALAAPGDYYRQVVNQEDFWI